MNLQAILIGQDTESKDMHRIKFLVKQSMHRETWIKQITSLCIKSYQYIFSDYFTW